MKKLSKEKQQHLILVFLGTLAVIAGLWFGVISLQKDKIKAIANKTKATQDQIDKIQRTVAQSAEIDASLQSEGARLAQIEDSMASGDLYSWIVTALKQFNVPGYRVDMPQYGIPVVKPVSKLPSFPYEQASVTVAGTAYYDDFGKFLAEFENHFPYMWIQNLNLDAAPSNPNATVEERERLSFHMEIVSLIKPNNL